MIMYKNMAELLQDGQCGEYRLEHFTITDKDFAAKVRSGIPNGTYVSLKHRGEIVMSNTPMEQQTNLEFVSKAHGKVLIGGLGIGMILLAIQDKENVEHITVVEKSKEVVELVANQLSLNEKVNIIIDDVFTYKPSIRYNTIYMDIWNYINKDVYERDMKPLIARYRRYLVKKEEDEQRYIDCWCKYQAKKGIRI